MIDDPEAPVDQTRFRAAGLLNRADAAVRRTVSEVTVSGRRVDARFYFQHLGAFIVFTLGFYRIFPKFLMQNVDGVNLYVVLDKLNVWRSSPWEVSTVTPLESMTSTLWFPLNLTFIPPFSIFAISTDPTLRVYLLPVFASVVVFVSSLFFYVAMGCVRPVAVAAAWLSFVLIMLQDTNLLQGINNVQVLAWAYVCLALLAYVGRLRSWRGALVLVLFQVTVLAYAMGDPVWHLTTLPVFGIVALAILIGAETAIERWLKLASLAIALVVQLALQTYVFLFYTLADTARNILPREYADIHRQASSGGYLFRNDVAAVTVGLLLIFGLAIGHIGELSVRPRLTNWLVKASLVFFIGVSVAGYIYLHYPQSPAFRTGYIVEMAYPLAALFIVGALLRLVRIARSATSLASTVRLAGGWRSASMLVVGLGVYLGWHIRANPEGSEQLVGALLALVSVCLLIRFGWERPAIAVAAVVLVVALEAHLDAAWGGGASAQSDGVARMGLAGNPLVQQLVEETAIRPGAAFRGYVEDLYMRNPDSPNVGDELVGHWLQNRDGYLNGQTLFSWSMFDIPTISEYDPFVRPLYYAFFTRLLNEPTDQQLDNYLGATRPNTRIMELMGVRFIVTDRPYVDQGLDVLSYFGRFRVLETPSPNLASYSPTQPVPAPTAQDALAQLQSDAFDPQVSVSVESLDNLPELVAASSTDLRFERGGYSIHASSPGWSLLVLPIQYSHCYVLDGASAVAQNARLLRVNLVQTGLLVHGDIAVDAGFRHWPFASPDCQRQDYADTIRLGVADVQRPASTIKTPAALP